ncbi:DNA-binding transcriptional regulator, MarR family [Pseudomonas sp. NFACC15-1]|uniref:MarR family winged helix-turn-helix transcriptional regulator n=1 Tax=Pseudomonas TaxID=286 RepID=UPI000882BEFD|nr:MULTISPECIES: MarR family transcriptional regulator [unclassified Pseudomonas]SDA40291.1 DNA-binding transcriptional regulator, MarR family [Pseudomonas sp. NFACC15-1]SDW34327.1 DNA-binding transcriptional regulator, MarR family [Pseudomonas sp. NFACC14]SFA74823.1 DNA-binding transcriptional regulator, MarR family [Pseudomonas sp. NFIX10]SFE01206.1 DNA-binding transcriptional regulator, MarR family [Pseudomonas sp. NFACC06-1]
MDHLKQHAAATWIKRYYVASRAIMEATLRPYDLGSTQWYILWQLANNGPTVQREFLKILQVEKPSLSEMVGALVRKGFIEQTPTEQDQRQRLLTITPSGLALWQQLPDPIDLVLKVSFDKVEATELATLVRVLEGATARLTHLLTEGGKP